MSAVLSRRRVEKGQPDCYFMHRLFMHSPVKYEMYTRAFGYRSTSCFLPRNKSKLRHLACDRFPRLLPGRYDEGAELEARGVAGFARHGRVLDRHAGDPAGLGPDGSQAKGARPRPADPRISPPLPLDSFFKDCDPSRPLTADLSPSRSSRRTY